jgi:ankyrin repeat protein
VLWVREAMFSSRLRSSVSFRGSTALHYAMLGENGAIAELLLARGANPMLRNDANHVPSDYCNDEQMLARLAQYSEKVHEYFSFNNDFSYRYFLRQGLYF